MQNRLIIAILCKFMQFLLYTCLYLLSFLVIRCLPLCLLLFIRPFRYVYILCKSMQFLMICYISCIFVIQWLWVWLIFHAVWKYTVGIMLWCRHGSAFSKIAHAVARFIGFPGSSMAFPAVIAVHPIIHADVDFLVPWNIKAPASCGSYEGRIQRHFACF